MGLREAVSCFPEAPSALSSRLSLRKACVFHGRSHLSFVGLSWAQFQSEPASGEAFPEKSPSPGLLPQGPTREQQAVCCRQTVLGVTEEAWRQGRSAGVGFYSRKSTEVKP